jgi:hypothetical protein
VANHGLNRRDIDRARKEKAAAKRARRQHASENRTEVDQDTVSSAGHVANHESEAELLEALRTLHERFEQQQLTFATFEEQRDEIMSKLAGN